MKKKMEKMRLNKYLASQGVASRREIDKMVLRGEIEVNGKIPEIGLKVDKKDTIKINGKPLKAGKQKNIYYLLNKPRKVISAVSDDRGRRTVTDFLKNKGRVYPIGRLDYETEGLIIMTNDGELYNNVIHPKAEVYKKYVVQAKGRVKKSALSSLKNGIKLEDGVTLPAKVQFIREEGETTWFSISIREGRNRQVRRMVEAIGHRVMSLQRTRIGNITLGNLEVGGVRPLTKEEVRYLKSL